MNPEKILRAEKLITKKCFLEVIPRFQNIPEGVGVSSKLIFYEYDNDSISVKPQALSFFKTNHPFVRKAVILEWAKYLFTCQEVYLLICLPSLSVSTLRRYVNVTS